jgi:mono/diheme cytochrome c family protein
LPPILTKEGSRDLVLAAGKQGYVYAIDAGSGAIVWKTSVGRHNGHDHDNEIALKGEYNKMPKLPVTVLPGALGGVETQMALADGVVYAPIVNIASVFKTQEKLSLEIPKGTGAMVALNVSDGSLKWQHDLPQPAYGAATVSNDLVFTTTFEGKLIALDRDNGNVVWEKQMPAGTNANMAIVGDTLITAASFPQSKGQQPVIIAYRLGATGAGPTTTAGTTTSTAGVQGKQVFVSNCGSCHTLGAAGTTGSVGPNLDQLKPNAARVRKQVVNGGPGMPSFGGRLSAAQIAAVAKYVAQNAGKVKSSGGGGGP